MKAIVVGGGIGGLATAVALLRAGHEVEVLEQAPAFTEVGAGLTLWPNAVRALEALGLGDAVRARSLVATDGGIRDSSGRWLARQDISTIRKRFGPLLMIHRADLLDALREAVPGPALRAGTIVTEVTADGIVTHASGQRQADVVIAADGVNSTARRVLWPAAKPPRYAGYVAYRMLTTPLPLPAEGGEGRVRHEQRRVGETWGRGERFGYVPLPHGRYYCFAAITAPPGSVSEGLAGLRRRFAHWHPPIPRLLEAIPDDEALLFHDLMELPPLDSYVCGRVALLGDAAHAMTPNLGQGAGLALEDAATLGHLVGGVRDAEAVSAALADYDRHRRHRTQRVAARSRSVGTVGQLSAGPAVVVRNLVTRMVPDALFNASLAPLLDWQPPSAP
ncbi:MAG TPA: FAD-dependent monooxygenase [Segeticoccus sp.]|uniref:FAD-dependent monooxygenase n=1 Tax=Segeticoccus sp. TaxID=2706531 RepID=UPI002D7EC876|nr:FAD-dependent monooxygenase [Segeticoccus sp.]HET8600860.1 FAD-dependent monooxygenase [Segeticoccus sp.]